MDDLRGKYLAAIAAAADEAALEDVRVQALGKKGEISLAMRGLGGMSPEERQIAGPALNALQGRDRRGPRGEAKAALADAALDDAARGRNGSTSPSRGRPRRQGTIHPVSQVTDEITAIFADMGFSVAEGPQIETDWHNFDALNIPPEHPARAEHDTFYMARAEGDNRPPHVLRTHTSPVQIRHDAGARRAPAGSSRPAGSTAPTTTRPTRRCSTRSRASPSTATSPWRTSSGCSRSSAAPSSRSTAVELSFRASHFPFTEPSAEVDIRCSWEGGKLKLGEGDDWLEILGSGMVHPEGAGRRRASTRRSGRASPSAWGSTGSPC